MKDRFETIITSLIGDKKDNESLAGIEIPEQLKTSEDSNAAIARNLNAAFLISLSGVHHSLHAEAAEYMSHFESHPVWEKTVRFYRTGIELIQSEISELSFKDDIFENSIIDLSRSLTEKEAVPDLEEAIDKMRNFFFPEGQAGKADREEQIRELRDKRTINNIRLNNSPVTDPSGEILFTSNILITNPDPTVGLDDLSLSSSLRRSLEHIIREEQIYWYDHPIPIGVSPEHNEVLYGLEGLDRAVEFEKERGTIRKEARVKCLLSVSVTHEGLQGIAREYLSEELKKEKDIKHLDIYIFTEADTLKLIEEILIPAADEFSPDCEHNLLYEVIGVDGEYGRHYSFLKAIAAFWQVFENPGIKGTFKIDLDQVFPQKELVEQSGLSAFEHLMTPLWGATGTDSEGNDVELGMIAGALVNQKDINHSLFYPDVRFPEKEIKADEVVFFSSLPQAVSTEAEMMTRYSGDSPDGKESCIQRVHVTGGTNGILLESLRKHRPFTPTFIGRAEDQAYILSILFDNSKSPEMLRYAHKDGLIMRHDKEAFAGEAIKMAAMGKLIGDYVRILMFSYYLRALPWSFGKIKALIDPFTGCFASPIPLTIVYLRFALKLSTFFTHEDETRNLEGFEFSRFGIKRLQETIDNLTAEPDPLQERYEQEKRGWKIYYDLLDHIEEAIKKGSPSIDNLKNKADELVSSCRIDIGPR